MLAPMPPGPARWPDETIDAASAAADAEYRARHAGKRSRLAWCITGSGHGLAESLQLMAVMPHADLLVSQAGEEVLGIYGHSLDSLRQQLAPGSRVLRDKTASAVPVGLLYDDVWHTVVVAPATSNTVAKCAFGFSDSLPSNMVAQAGKLGILSIVYACDTEPVVVTESPRGPVVLRPRRLELDNVARLREIEHTQVVESTGQLAQALDARLAALGLQRRATAAA